MSAEDEDAFTGPGSVSQDVPARCLAGRKCLPVDGVACPGEDLGNVLDRPFVACRAGGAVPAVRIRDPLEGNEVCVQPVGLDQVRESRAR